MAKHKKTIIKNIKAIIENIGETTSADMGLNSSPVLHNSTKDACTLIESLGLHKATAVHYAHETETGEDYISYEDLPTNVLAEILFNLEYYKNDLEKTMEKCRNNNY